MELHQVPLVSPRVETVLCSQERFDGLCCSQLAQGPPCVNRGEQDGVFGSLGVGPLTRDVDESGNVGLAKTELVHVVGVARVPAPSVARIALTA